VKWLKLQLWLYRNRLMWFQRRRPRHEYPTTIYAGMPGSGKTLLMVRDVVRLMRRGFDVYSNMAIHDPLTGQMCGVVGSWLDMLRLSVVALEERADALDAGREPVPGVIFAFDELHLICDAREWAKTPKWWLNLIAQRRHLCVGVIGTTQVASQVEKRLRTLMDYQISVFRPWRRILGLRAIPLFAIRELNPAAVEFDPLNAESKETRHILMPWYAYAGYSTTELVTSDDWAGYTDDESSAEIQALTERAKAAAARLGSLPLIFCDEYADTLTSFDVDDEWLPDPPSRSPRPGDPDYAYTVYDSPLANPGVHPLPTDTQRLPGSLPVSDLSTTDNSTANIPGSAHAHYMFPGDTSPHAHTISAPDLSQPDPTPATDTLLQPSNDSPASPS